MANESETHQLVIWRLKYGQQERLQRLIQVLVAAQTMLSRLEDAEFILSTDAATGEILFSVMLLTSPAGNKSADLGHVQTVAKSIVAELIKADRYEQTPEGLCRLP